MKRIIPMLMAGLFGVCMFLVQGCCCSKESPGDPLPLIETQWILDLNSLSEIDSSWEKPGKEITLMIDNASKVAGVAGINRYFGSAEINAGGKIKFAQMASTMMAGPGMQYESAYLKILGTVDTYKIEEDKLILLSAGKTVAVFNALPAVN